jgi:hypothetical protein
LLLFSLDIELLLVALTDRRGNLLEKRLKEYLPVD